MSKQFIPVSIEIIQFICGFSDFAPPGTRDYLELRAEFSELKAWVPARLLAVPKSKAKKVDWVEAFMMMSRSERQDILTEHRKMVLALPRDLKVLKTLKIEPCGTKAFNPGKRVEFNVYAVMDVLEATRSF